jgi:hypothetical protein
MSCAVAGEAIEGAPLAGLDGEVRDVPIRAPICADSVFKHEVACKAGEAQVRPNTGKAALWTFSAGSLLVFVISSDGEATGFGYE